MREFIVIEGGLRGNHTRFPYQPRRNHAHTKWLILHRVRMSQQTTYGTILKHTQGLRVSEMTPKAVGMVSANRKPCGHTHNMPIPFLPRNPLCTDNLHQTPIAPTQTPPEAGHADTPHCLRLLPVEAEEGKGHPRVLITAGLLVPTPAPHQGQGQEADLLQKY